MKEYKLDGRTYQITQRENCNLIVSNGRHEIVISPLPDNDIGTLLADFPGGFVKIGNRFPGADLDSAIKEIIGIADHIIQGRNLKSPTHNDICKAMTDFYNQLN